MWHSGLYNGYGLYEESLRNLKEGLKFTKDETILHNVRHSLPQDGKKQRGSLLS
jgi:hypothetical protein